MESTDLAQIFKKLRKTAGLSQIEMAKIINRDQATVSRLEKGSQHPSLDTIFSLSKFFNIKSEKILNGQINYWAIGDSFDNPVEVNPRYKRNQKSLVRELVPLLRFFVKKMGADELRIFLGEFGLEDLVVMGPEERISSFIYFDLLAKALERELLTKEDIPSLIRETESLEYHGLFYDVYKKQKNSFDVVKAYCLNSLQYEGAIKNSIISEKENALTVGFSVSEEMEDIDFSANDMGLFLVDYKMELLESLSHHFGHEKLIIQAPKNKNKLLRDEVCYKLIRSA